jgi:hypothetical protein
MCRCSQGEQPAHPAHPMEQERTMGRYDFDFGYNLPPTDDVPEYPTTTNDRDGEENKEQTKMDLSKEVSGKKRNDFEKRDWIAPEDLPAKGASKWKIDSTRDAKKNKTGILLYVDLTRGKIKRVMSLRKNFTLDMFVEELGSNSDKWAGKTIELERGGAEGQYVNVAG